MLSTFIVLELSGIYKPFVSLFPLENYDTYDCHCHANSLAPLPGLLLHTEPSEQFDNICYSKLSDHNKHYRFGRSQGIHTADHSVGDKGSDGPSQKHISGLHLRYLQE